MSATQLMPAARRLTRSAKVLKKNAKPTTMPEADDLVLREIAYVLHLTRRVRQEIDRESKGS